MVLLSGAFVPVGFLQRNGLLYYRPGHLYLNVHAEIYLDQIHKKGKLFLSKFVVGFQTTLFSSEIHVST